MSTKLISTGYTPRQHQVELHQRLRRFNIVICHRRFGKTHLAVNTLVHKALTCKLKQPRMFYLAPNYAQAKRIAWDIFKQYTSMIPGVEYNEAELRIDIPLNGARIQLLSAENPASIRGIYADFMVLDEYGDMAPSVWSEAVRPALSDRLGGALFIGTVKGQNHFWDMYEQVRDGNDPEWFSALYKASETKIIPDSELESAKKTMSEEAFAAEYECDPLGGLVGAYFAKEMARAHAEKRIGIVPHDAMMPVDTYWDLGVNDAMAIWFCQSIRNQHRMIEYYETSGASIPDVIAELRKKRYDYGAFVLPHDANVRDMSTGQARIQQFYTLGCRNVRVVPRVGTKMESINAARVKIGTTWFDLEKCKVGIKSLSNYKKSWDEKRQTFSNTPLHDWASNGADAFQQFGMGSRADSGISSSDSMRNRRGEMVAEVEFNPYSRSV